MYVSVLSASISCSSFLFFLFRFYVFHALILEFIQSPGRHLGFSPTFFMFGLAAATATDPTVYSLSICLSRGLSGRRFDSIYGKIQFRFLQSFSCSALFFPALCQLAHSTFDWCTS